MSAPLKSKVDQVSTFFSHRSFIYLLCYLWESSAGASCILKETQRF